MRTCEVCGKPAALGYRGNPRRTCSKECRYALVARALQGRALSPEHRARTAAGVQRRWADPEYRARQATAMRSVYSDPESRKKMSEGIRRAWADPAFRAHQRRINAGNTYAKDAPVKGECAYCLGPAQTWDHVLPRREPYGGSDHPANLVLACWSCQTSKGRRDPWAWLAAGLVGRRP